MKAVVYERYGPPDVLELREIDKPVPKDNEVLVKVMATSVTAGDWRVRKADPFLVRLMNGLFKPRKAKILGFEIAGVVEEIGTDVRRFKKGDEVFAACGFKFGGYAEYKCLREDDLELKPTTMSFEEAATVPIGGISALRLARKAAVKDGDHVLIYGASGSVGTFAIQIANAFGGKVTAVCSTSNLELVKSIGAAAVVDYTKADFTQMPLQFDVIFDAVGKTSKSACQRLLKPGGRYVTVAQILPKGENDLQFLKTMAESGKLRSVIDKTYSLGQIREAHAYVEQFRKRGNVAIRVGQF